MPSPSNDRTKFPGPFLLLVFVVEIKNGSNVTYNLPSAELANYTETVQDFCIVHISRDDLGNMHRISQSQSDLTQSSGQRLTHTSVEWRQSTGPYSITPERGSISHQKYDDMSTQC